MVSPELISFRIAGEWQRQGQALFGCLRDTAEILFDQPRIDGSLLNLNDVALAVDQERCWQSKIAVPVKQVAIKNVVYGRDVGTDGHHLPYLIEL